MANVDRPNGFKPVKSLIGADWTALIRVLQGSDRSADTTNNHGDIYVGDPLKYSSGLLLPANSGDTIIGVCVGVGTVPDHGDGIPAILTDLSQSYLPHTDTTGFVWFVPKKSMLFEIQTATDIDLVPGSTADITVTAATAHGSRTTGISTCELVVSSNADVTVFEDDTRSDNDVTLINARHLVQIA